MDTNKYVSWKSVTPIIADVVVSPWNILIGGLLIRYLSFKLAILSIVSGYIFLSLIFYLYGSLGFKYRSKTSELIEPVFGKSGTKYLFSTILAIGQIGWFAIITFIGGESLGYLLNTGTVIGILLYAFLMYLMAILKLHNMGIVKLFITLSSAGLIIYLITAYFGHVDFSELWKSSTKSNSLIWGVSVIASSLISFTAVTPDFFSQVREKNDIVVTILLGLTIPGIIITSVGAVLFYGLEQLSFKLLIGSIAFSSLGFIFNVITNTDASIAIYTPGNRINYMFGINFKLAVAIAAIIGTVLSLLRITENIEIWLLTLAGIYPSVIIITLTYYYIFNATPIKPATRNINMAIAVILGFLIFFINSTYLIWTVIIAAFVFSTIVLYLQQLKNNTESQKS